MKFPEISKSSGIGTTGAIGLVLLIAVIWNQINPWWLVLSILLLISGIGQENRK